MTASDVLPEYFGLLKWRFDGNATEVLQVSAQGPLAQAGVYRGQKIIELRAGGEVLRSPDEWVHYTDSDAPEALLIVEQAGLRRGVVIRRQDAWQSQISELMNTIIEQTDDIRAEFCFAGRTADITD